SPVGLVAVLPVGMCQVSSVVMTADVGVKLRKGEEFAYFQFGGSDVVMLFESSVNAGLIMQPGVHYKQGSWIGHAFPG
ncbi:phosphatidylserine decarboxylase, partial [Rivihabitans pingtungensis]